MHLVCSFVLPSSLRPSDLIDWLEQMITLHAGVTVFVEHEPSESDDSETLKVLIGEHADAATVRAAIDTNRPDWHSAGVLEIRSTV